MEFALGAEVVIRDGLAENISLVDYRVTRAADMPEIEVILVEDAEESGPYGSRGIGTPAMTPVLPAIANAVRDALGKRVESVPMTPELIRSVIDAF
jgi:CO/xanthine dehydrogenase Mo-binding subunit